MNSEITPNNGEQLTEQLIQKAKNQAAAFIVPENPESQEIFKLIETLNSAPKSPVPMANYDRVRNQILDRIAIPVETPSAFGFFQAIPNFVKIGGGIIGTFLILISLTIGTAIAAIQSVPGQPIYPVKKVVENIQLRLADTESEKVSLQIKFANNRLEELETVLQQQQEGKVSDESLQKVVEQTVRDVSSVVSQNSASGDQPQILSKLVDLNAKQTTLLQTASDNSEGEIKEELEKALVTSKASQEQTFADIEKAGLKIENNIITISDKTAPDQVQAHGKLTDIDTNDGFISIGTARFFLTKETIFVNIKREDLEVDQIISIKGKIEESKTYAVEVTVDEPVDEPETDNETDTTPPPPPATVPVDPEPGDDSSNDSND